MNTTIPWLAYPLLLFPRRLRKTLKRVHAARLVPHTPNPWQLALGVLRMWHRMLFRPETVGTSPEGRVRDTWRARLLHLRPLRFPFLVLERAIAPWDMTGLVSSPNRIIRHLLGAFHDGDEFVYDLQILSCYPGALDSLHARTHALVHQDSPRARWLRDLVVFEGYHERLLAEVEHALAHGVRVPEHIAHDPDLCLSGYLRWCAAQPATPRETWAQARRGTFRIATGSTALPALESPR
jgi:hypothetical protein